MKIPLYGGAISAAVCLAACAAVLPVRVAAEDNAAGYPFPQIWNGLVQPPHESPIAPLTAFGGQGLSDAAGPGFAAQPVLSFFPALRQHRDAGPTPPAPLFAFGQAQYFMPYRKDHARLDPGGLETMRTTADDFKLTAGYAGPGDTYETYGQATTRQPQAYIRGFATAAGTWDDSFDDGNGNTVPYQFRLNTQQMVVGWTPSARMEVFGVLLRNEIDDFATPSAGLDNIETDRLVGRTGIELRDGGLGFDRLRGELSVRAADRVNNNFGIRTFVPGAGNRRQQVEAERNFQDLSLIGDVAIGAMEHRFGLKLGRETRNFTRFSDSVAASPTPQLDIVSAFTIPDVEKLEAGTSWEGATDVRPDLHLKLGARYRHVFASAGATNQVPQGPFAIIVPGLAASAANLYSFYYGPSIDTTPDFHLVDARALLEQSLVDDRVSIFGDFSYLERAPDTKELFIASTAPPAAAANRIIGNPNLAKERHLRLGLGVVADGPDWVDFGRSRRSGPGIQTGAWRLSAGLKFDHVDDFISRDRARGQAGVAANDGAVVFRNVDATLMSAEMDLFWNLTPHLSTRASLVYTHGTNREENRPLYGIAPLEGSVLIDWTDDLADIGTWSAGGRLRLVADQNRVDDNPATGSAFDEGETDGFAVVDIYLRALIRDRIALSFGVANLLDASYREHVALSSVEAPQRARIYAPGRTVYVRAGMAF